MKKVTYISAIMALSIGFQSCKNDSPTEDATITTVENSKSVQAPTADNMHRWAGTYEGTLPCASCSGIKVELILNADNTYQLREEYLGKKDGVFIEKGNFSFDEPTKIINIIIGEEVKKYQVGEQNIVTVLNNEGKIITGPTAGDYVLQKKIN